jgi:GNAT superfamily N-acetyltransferase
MNIEYKNNITVKDYNSLRKSVEWTEIVEEQAQRGINNSSFLTVAYDKNKAVGMTRIVSDGGYIAIIVDVIVLPEYQNNGIGKQMLNNAIEYLKSTVNENEIVMINLMAMKGRESFYKQFDFIERPNENMGAGMVRWLIQNK